MDDDATRPGDELALAVGTVFSVARMMQGAHFLSHNLRTRLIDWTICLLCYRWVLYYPSDKIETGQLPLTRLPEAA